MTRRAIARGRLRQGTFTWIGARPPSQLRRTGRHRCRELQHPNAGAYEPISLRSRRRDSHIIDQGLDDRKESECAQPRLGLGRGRASCGR
jgi:hypothetical protein